MPKVTLKYFDTCKTCSYDLLDRLRAVKTFLSTLLVNYTFCELYIFLVWMVRVGTIPGPMWVPGTVFSNPFRLFFP